jgi:hypothetical protein
METSDMTIEVLKSIRDEVRGVRGGLDSLRSDVNTGLAELRADLNDLHSDVNGKMDALERRQTVEAMRLSSEVVAVAGAVGALTDELRRHRPARNRLDDLEHRVEALEKRTG